jgi:hypothetical protein
MKNRQIQNQKKDDKEDREEKGTPKTTPTKKVNFNSNTEEDNLNNIASKPTPIKNNQSKAADQINNLMSCANSNSKRKNSLNSNGSNKKKKVSFKINHNQLNQYDMLKPITLISNRKMHDIKSKVPNKGSLKIKNKNKK